MKTSAKRTGPLGGERWTLGAWSLAFGLAAAPGLASAGGPVYDFAAVTALANGAMAGQNVGTAVPGFELLLLKDGERVYHAAFGAYTIGQLAIADSSTKTISGAVIASLLDSSPNPFTLDTRLSTYIPEFSGAKQSITIRQAFSHTAGFGNSAALGNPFITLYEAALDIANDNLRYVPGTVFSYGGTSMHATGAVAEIAGGASWNALFQQRIAVPLGWTQTRYTLSSAANPRIAGGCESNAEEFSRLMEMLRTGGLHSGSRVLSEAAVTAMLTRQSPVGIPVANSPVTGVSDYGIGIWLDQRDGTGRLIGALAGGARGFCSWVDLDDGMVGVIATDLTSFSNIENLQYLIRAAAEQAVRQGGRCASDLDDGSGSGNPDGGVGIEDLLYFLSAYRMALPAADVDNGTGTGTPDGGLGIEDLLFYLDRYETGC